MAGFFYKGILLEQYKEPALSRELREFFNAETAGTVMDRKPVDDPSTLTAAQIIEIAKDAQIIDERDGKPLWEKLQKAQKKNIKTLVADAIDDEPYISSQLNPLLKNIDLAAQGLRLAATATDALHYYFAIYKSLTDLEVKIPKTIEDIRVQRIMGRYPAEYQASKNFLQESEVLLIGVCALIFLARAVQYNRPQTTTFITVAGNCVSNPTNLEVSLGMTVMQVLERCGLVQEPNRIVVGGSMTGISIIDTEKNIITPITRGVLAFKEDVKNLHFSCIGCSRCVHACPEGLNPYYLYKSVVHNRVHEFTRHDAALCIGCATCSYVCPSKLDLSTVILEGRTRFTPLIESMNAIKEKEKADLLAREQAYLTERETLKELSLAQRREAFLKKVEHQKQTEVEKSKKKSAKKALEWAKMKADELIPDIEEQLLAHEMAGADKSLVKKDATLAFSTDEIATFQDSEDIVRARQAAQECLSNDSESVKLAVENEMTFDTRTRNVEYHEADSIVRARVEAKELLSNDSESVKLAVENEMTFDTKTRNVKYHEADSIVRARVEAQEMLSIDSESVKLAVENEMTFDTRTRNVEYHEADSIVRARVEAKEMLSIDSESVKQAVAKQMLLDSKGRMVRYEGGETIARAHQAAKELLNDDSKSVKKAVENQLLFDHETISEVAKIASEKTAPNKPLVWKIPEPMKPPQTTSVGSSQAEGENKR